MSTPIRADNSTKDKSGNPKKFSKTKKEFRQLQFILDMTVNHKTYGGMNISFLIRNLIKHEIWDSVSLKNRKWILTT